ncbi:MAG: DUF2202 domain-containing protein [Thiovulaceae bacterium]|nr:DUF2202 domain-containing protein [Sulfurimonadaceae bacterium]
MKTIFTKLLIGATSVLTLTLACSCQKANSEQLNGVRNSESQLYELQANYVTTSDLTTQESADLIKMKEEEKLARDVYSALYKKWNSNVFANITSSEDSHMNAIISLLKYYNIAETSVLGVGQFVNPDIQNLYNQLIAKGSTSIADAYATGALIEDLDINDLDNCITKTTNSNLLLVYNNIRSGSYNHLNAFVSQLSYIGLTYTPTYISQDEYNVIIASFSGSGGKGRKSMR